MSDLLNIGASGVRAYQTALTTVSENIANVGTAGYSKRTTDLSEVMGGGGAVTQRITLDGNGVLATGVSRAADQLKSANVRSASTDLSRSETGIAWLGRIQTALTGNQLTDRLTGFFTATTSVAADPTATTPRAAMIEAAGSVANAFSATGKALDSVASDLDATAQDAVNNLSSLGAALAKVNDGLGRATAGTSGAAQLLDQRDQILEQVSAISDIAVSTDAAGRATVNLGGSGGPVLVAGGVSGDVTYARGTTGAVAFAVRRGGTSTGFAPSGGVLAGVVDGATRIQSAQEGLDAVASAFTGGVNAAQAGGRDLDGNPGAPLFTVGADPSDMALSLTDPRGIAAASVGGGQRDNSNLQAFAAVRASGASESRTTQLVTDNAAALAARQQVADAQSAIRDGAVVTRDSVSGVNLDNEAVDLMRFQQAYSASSRIIQVARETFQSILDIH
ncbi:MAG: flagellar hook-associated protein FlgK [Sphingomonas sp.]